MIKKIVTDLNVLQKKSTECFFREIEVMKNERIIQDMLDTAEANRENCIGLAAIQINVPKRIILVEIDGVMVVMVNPSFTPVRSAGIKKYKEGCLSLPERMFVNRIIKRRFKKIKVTYQWVTGRIEKITLKNLEAVIVQHEVDHLNGVII
jgi:peptide deformylase